MPEVIRSVRGYCACEKIIEKSRFLSCCEHVTNEDEAKAFIAKVRATYPTATHNCYGFVADKTGAMQRFSDDGEPQGTAGMPILDVIKNKKLYETAVVVTRYFGGIKLGAGGLVRAYSSSAADVLSAAEICLWQTCVRLVAETDYPHADALLKFLSRGECIPEDTQYADTVKCAVRVKKAETENFIAALTDYMSGRIRIERGEEAYYPFTEK